MSDSIYKSIVDDLERDLLDIEEELLKTDKRKDELLERRFELLVGIDGIKQMMKGRSND